jgi:hypothetical protein
LNVEAGPRRSQSSLASPRDQHRQAAEQIEESNAVPRKSTGAAASATIVANRPCVASRLLAVHAPVRPIRRRLAAPGLPTLRIDSHHKHCLENVLPEDHQYDRQQTVEGSDRVERLTQSRKPHRGLSTSFFLCLPWPSYWSERERKRGGGQCASWLPLARKAAKAHRKR